MMQMPKAKSRRGAIARTRGRIKITHRCIIRVYIYIYIQNEHSVINEHAVIEVYELIIYFFMVPKNLSLGLDTTSAADHPTRQNLGRNRSYNILSILLYCAYNDFQYISI
jgi:hypothetical protein